VTALAAARQGVLALSRTARRAVSVLRRLRSRRSLRRCLFALGPVVRDAREAVCNGINDVLGNSVVRKEDGGQARRINLNTPDRVTICGNHLHKSVDATQNRSPAVIGYNMRHPHISIMKLPEESVISLRNMEDVIGLIRRRVLDETDGKGDGHVVCAGG
jgi:hypothetical protein